MEVSWPSKRMCQEEKPARLIRPTHLQQQWTAEATVLRAERVNVNFREEAVCWVWRAFIPTGFILGHG